MSLTRTIAGLFFTASSFAMAACGTSQEAAKEDTALVISKMKNGGSVTLTTAGGACGSLRELLTKNGSQLQALCPKGEAPVPVDVNDAGCTPGDVISIKFECAAVSAPELPPGVCRELPVRDDDHTLSARGGAHLASTAGVICPSLGGRPRADGDAPRPPSGERDVGGDRAGSDERPADAPRAPDGARGGETFDEDAPLSTDEPPRPEDGRGAPGGEQAPRGEERPYVIECCGEEVFDDDAPANPESPPAPPSGR